MLKNIQPASSASECPTLSAQPHPRHAGHTADLMWLCLCTISLVCYVSLSEVVSVFLRDLPRLLDKL